MQNGDMHGADHTEAHDAANQQHGSEGRPPASFKERFVIPLSIPLAAVALGAAVIASISQILLALSGPAATTVAMLIALCILLIGGFLATAPRLKRQTMTASIAVPLLCLFVAGISTGIYRQTRPPEKAGPVTAGAPPTEVTTDDKFSVTSYTIQANAPTTIEVKNSGALVHNFHILDVKDPSGKDVATELLQPGNDVKLAFTIAQEGTYKFQCDVHPTEMFGTITAQPQSAAPAAAVGAAGAGGGTTEVTTDNKFSQTTITIDHGVPVTVSVQNKGAAIHNWDVTGLQSADGKPVKTDFVPPGQTATLSFQIDKPGSYPFACDVHPTEMMGTLVVK